MSFIFQLHYLEILTEMEEEVAPHYKLLTLHCLRLFTLLKLLTLLKLFSLLTLLKLPTLPTLLILLREAIL